MIPCCTVIVSSMMQIYFQKSAHWCLRKTRASQQRTYLCWQSSHIRFSAYIAREKESGEREWGQEAIYLGIFLDQQWNFGIGDINLALMASCK
jgi:hypothetical protein